MKLLIATPRSEIPSVSNLGKDGFLIEKVDSFHAAIQQTAVYFYDVVIIFVTVPDRSVRELIASIEHNSPRTGVIVVSDAVGVEEKISILSEGADDYIVNPFHPLELSARVKTLVRRCTMGGSNEVGLKGVKIDPARRRVSCRGRIVELTRKEYELLFFFLRNPEKILTHEMIAEYLWGDLKSISADCFDFIYCHVKNIRKKLAGAGAGKFIDTVYGVGYVVR